MEKEKEKEIDRLFKFILRHSFEDVKCFEIWSDECSTRIDIATKEHTTNGPTKLTWHTFNFESGCENGVLQLYWPWIQQYVRDFKEKEFTAHLKTVINKNSDNETVKD